MNILKNIDPINEPMTWLVVVIVTVASIAGAVVVIVNPDTLSFHQYLDDLEKFVIGAGILGIGRGAAAAAKVGSKIGDTDELGQDHSI